MKARLYLLFFTAFICFTGTLHSQVLVLDKEKLFTAGEVKQMDSLLQAYHTKSGNLVAVYTDSVDFSGGDFGDYVYASFKRTGSDNAYSFILEMSRTQSLLFSLVNKKTAPFASQQQLIGILEPGFASLQEKRTAEGVIKICTVAMEFLDSLPKKK